jgi:hypothetical protein
MTDWRQRHDAVAISAVNLTEVLVARRRLIPRSWPRTLERNRAQRSPSECP